MQANPFRRQVGGGRVLELETVLGLVKWNRAIWGPKTFRFPGPNPLPLAQVMDLPTSTALSTWPDQAEVHSFLSTGDQHYIP